MDSGGVSSSSFGSSKSKKVLCLSVNKQHSSDEAVGAPDVSPWISQTSQKPTHPRRRSVTRRQVLQAAKHLRKLDMEPSVSPDPLKSSATPSETLITKRKTFKALPERYGILDRIFSSLQSSIRLVGLSGSTSTFTNISSMVEKSTSRFDVSHLAQLKFILHKVIEIKKIRVHGCIKPDLHVSLDFGIIRNVEKLKSKSKSLRMRNLFRSRLVSYYNSSREGDEFPKAILPEPFGPYRRVTSSSTAMENPVSQQYPVEACHMLHSFKRWFSP